MNIDMAMFHQAFFEEATDLLADLEGYLLRLEEAPNDLELLNCIFRCAHSLKGGGATFGFADIAHFTHGLETLLDKLRTGAAHADAMIIQLLLESLDQLKALLAVARGEREDARSSEPLINRITAAIAACDGTLAGTPNSATGEGEAWGLFEPQAQPTGFHLHFRPGEKTLRQGSDPLLLMAEVCDLGATSGLRCDTSLLPSLAELDPEGCWLAWELDIETEVSESQIREVFNFVADESELQITPTVAGESVPETPAERGPIAEAGACMPIDVEAAADTQPVVGATGVPGSAPKGAEAHTLRVATDKVDKLINLVGELVINQSMLAEATQNFSMDRLPLLLEAVNAMERACRELQERVMAVRMLPIKHAFGRFPRLVRDAATACGKRIELKMSGEDTELDKSVIEAIGDPLTHLVRNAVDHGLEGPDDRRAAGKPECGTVTLHAYHEGGSIVVEVADDGRGLDRECILRKAVERGMVAEGDTPPDEAIYNFIFQAGFSTAAQVSDLSGRGVGMDIVRQAIAGLGGSITLNTKLGEGTRFRARLPLTMAILEGLSLLVGDEVYILPLVQIVESIRPQKGDVRTIAGADEIALVRGEALPILRLYELFGSTPRVTDPTQGLLVIVENEGRRAALLVDELIGQSQVVIKSLESNYRKVEGVAGATILGNGRVALIMDVPALMRARGLGQWGESLCAA